MIGHSLLDILYAGSPVRRDYSHPASGGPLEHFQLNPAVARIL